MAATGAAWRIRDSVAIADRSIVSRNHSILGTAVSQILTLPVPDAVKAYYEAALLDAWSPSLPELPDRILQIADSPATPALYRARSFSLLARAIGNRDGLEEARLMYAEALKVLPFCKVKTLASHSVLLASSFSLASIKAFEGDEKGCLSDLLKLAPLATSLRPFMPAQYFTFAGNLAASLGQAGQRTEAISLIEPAVRSPFGLNFPEWSETLSELMRPAPSRALISVPDLPLASNVIPLPVRETATRPKSRRPGVVIHIADRLRRQEPEDAKPKEQIGKPEKLQRILEELALNGLDSPDEALDSIMKILKA